ncbi:TPA: hypothetical protein TY878_001036 [Streptococcus suis]|nr:hypothetical protein [Streptococcus suis]HEL2093790.1 hypothetical protein [Streptococcus suis]HEL2101023.1 hypothetical protein [Streptococcus suis]HEL2182679.1 hypothetical protein [Streptococcus suis]
MIPKFRAWFGSEMYDKPVVYDGEFYLDWRDFEDGRTCNGAVLMQSTGLFDVNGKEVYIGDIVKCTRGCSHEVIFLKEYGGRYIGGMPAIYLSDIREGYAWTEDEEIIGNIYENPELVEEVTND